MTGAGGVGIGWRVGQALGLGLDELSEMALVALLQEPAGARALPALLARRCPDGAPLQIVVAMAMAAASVERALASVRDRQLAADSWQMAALVAADVHAMQGLGLPCTRAADLLAYWRAQDPFFLV